MKGIHHHQWIRFFRLSIRKILLPFSYYSKIIVLEHVCYYYYFDTSFLYNYNINKIFFLNNPLLRVEMPKNWKKK